MKRSDPDQSLFNIGLYRANLLESISPSQRPQDTQRTDPYTSNRPSVRVHHASCIQGIQPLTIQALDPRTQTQPDKNLNYHTITDMADIRRQIDEGQKRWPSGINAQSEGVDINEINDFVKFKPLEYDDYNFKDEDLWEAYRDDFKTFTLQTFRNCNQSHIRKLRALLRTNSVWVKKHRILTVPESLFNTL